MSPAWHPALMEGSPSRPSALSSRRAVPEKCVRISPLFLQSKLRRVPKAAVGLRASALPVCWLAQSWLYSCVYSLIPCCAGSCDMARAVLNAESTGIEKTAAAPLTQERVCWEAVGSGPVLGSAQQFRGSLDLVLPSRFHPTSVYYMLCVLHRGEREKNGSLPLGPISNCPPVCDVPRVMEGGAPNTGLGEHGGRCFSPGMAGVVSTP